MLMISCNPRINQAFLAFLAVKIKHLATPFYLQQTQQLLDQLGNPENSIQPVIHVSGTNGKGSTITFLSSILKQQGLKVCYYLKPHLLQVNERIHIGDQTIDDESLLRHLNTLKNLDPTPDIYQAMTLIFLLAFSEARDQTDVFIVESGMGGRFDCTNVLNSATQLITSIQNDHQSLLGHSLESIAWHKSGIFKPHGHGFVSACIEPMLIDSLMNHARSANMASLTVCPPLYDEFALGIPGNHQTFNAAIAVAAANNIISDLSHETIGKGLKQSSLTGRQQLITVQSRQAPTLVDVACNPAAIQALSDHLQQSKQLWQIIFASKQPITISRQMLNILAPFCDCLMITHSQSPRNNDHTYRLALSNGLGIDSLKHKIQTYPNLSLALTHTSPTQPLCITGSIFLVAEALRIFETL